MSNSIQYFLFDLDNTLYLPENGPLKEVDRRMNLFIMNEFGYNLDDAVNLRKKYYFQYGTTLGGLMEKHAVEPHYFLEFVHDVGDQYLPRANEELKDMLNSIPQRKFVVTNSYYPYAQKVIENLNISDCFEEIFDITFMDMMNKSYESSYLKVMKSIDSKAAADSYLMFDDVWKYLSSAFDLSMKTVLVNPVFSGNPHYHISSINDLPALLNILQVKN